MAPNVEAIIQEGVAAIKSGRKEDARRALMKAVDLDERNEMAWLWLSAVVETPEEQLLCLENVLSINPANQKAQKGLAAIQRASGQPPRPAAPPPPAAPSSPFDKNFDSGFDNNPFAGTGFDSNPYGSSPDPAFGSGWGGQDNVAPPASGSVDWNRAGGNSAYGSGKDVQLPSADEYDSWVSGLQLGGSAASNESGFGSGGFDSGFDPASGPFASSFNDNADPFGGSSAPQDPFAANRGGSSSFAAPASPAPPSNPFGDFSAPSAPSFENDSFDDSGDMFNAGSADPFGGSSAFGTPGRSDPFAASDPFNSLTPATSAPPRSGGDSFDGPFGAPANDPFDDDPVADLFSAVPGPTSSPKPKAPAAPPPPPLSSSNPFGSSPSNVFGGAAPIVDEFEPLATASPSSSGFAFVDSANSNAPGMLAYFKAIPAEIQAPKGRRKSKGGGGGARVILAVGVLAVLNMVSLAALVLSLMRR